jgi:outer membrane protein assembly factor BamD (BamD/ComL family)
VVLFTQGRIEQARGRFHAAALAFGRCWSRFPRGSLAEDALAEQAGALRAAGIQEQAAAAARQYLSRYPRGIHRRRMREILR